MSQLLDGGKHTSSVKSAVSVVVVLKEKHRRESEFFPTQRPNRQIRNLRTLIKTMDVSFLKLVDGVL